MHDKICTKCKQLKPVSDFSKDAKAIGGHRSYCKTCSAIHRAENKTRKMETDRARYLARAPEFRAYASEYRADHREQCNAYDARRDAMKKLATPQWASKRKIRSFYESAQARTQETGVMCHVDHVVPLMHPLVCGLHCESNLQIISRADNQSKRNRFVPGVQQ